MAREEQPGAIQPSWSELSYPGRGQEMNGFLDHDFVSPHSSFPSSANPYTTTTHTNGNIPTPISLSDSTFLEPRPSPSQSHHSQEFHYHDITDAGTHHGLGITGTTSTYMQPGIFAFDPSPHRQTIDNPFQPSTQLGAYSPRHNIDASGRPSPWTSPAIPTPQPSQTRGFPNIAPDPEGLRKLQRERRACQGTEATRRRSGSSRRNSGQRSKPSQMDKENEYILLLKEKYNLPWKTIVEKTNGEFGTTHTASCLQMRMTRLKQRAQQWSEDDIQALQKAHEFWEVAKFEIIAQKVRGYF
ncbi:hypothetical protein FQN52_001884 [Onygenales sp. PD_12]|nr:hypothetical protein FQN52_001884 [Onygenales sp. PD_12]KAK2806396.1 hypothetical protein FQN51_007440 [Onygenales sp. PD_10]